ncbi:MAG TPA: hypothetical protein VJG85_01525 [Patescibacteria group bacterium]|nr:hypothetical protein [Patescibacteria group bacterium]
MHLIIKKISRFLTTGKNEKGIGLIETIAALGVATIVVTSIVSLAVYTLRSSTNSKLMILGTKYATEEIEKLRALRDSSASWADFYDAVDGCAVQCYVSSSLAVNSGVESIATGGSENMQRYFWVTSTNPPTPFDISDGILRMNVSVTWNVGNSSKHTYIYTDLSNWRGL